MTIIIIMLSFMINCYTYIYIYIYIHIHISYVLLVVLLLPLSQDYRASIADRRNSTSYLGPLGTTYQFKFPKP